MCVFYRKERKCERQENKGFLFSHLRRKRKEYNTPFPCVTYKRKVTVINEH